MFVVTFVISNSSLHGLCTLLLVFCVLCYIRIYGTSSENVRLPLSVSMKKVGFASITALIKCLCVQILTCAPSFLVEHLYKKMSLKKVDYNFPKVILLVIYITTALISYGSTCYFCKYIPSLIVRAIVSITCTTQQIKTWVYAYINGTMRQEYLDKVNQNINDVIDANVTDANDDIDDNDPVYDVQPYCVERSLAPEFALKLKQKMYPNNVNVCDYAYYILAPTLCYQPVYPKTKCINVYNLILYALGILFGYMYIVPIAETLVVTSGKILCSQKEFFSSLSDYSTIGAYCILLLFVVFFSFIHCAYNFTAELLMFADRSFYGPWWNSTSAADYWKMWNLPVVNFNKSVLLPYLKNELKLPGYMAMMLIFVISGILHEIFFFPIISKTALSLLLLFLSQIPIIALTNFIQKLFPIFPPKNNFFKFVKTASFWVQFVICGTTLVHYILHHSWAEFLKCENNALVRPNNILLLGISTGYQPDIADVKSSYNSLV